MRVALTKAITTLLISARNFWVRSKLRYLMSSQSRIPAWEGLLAVSGLMTTAGTLFVLQEHSVEAINAIFIFISIVGEGMFSQMYGSLLPSTSRTWIFADRLTYGDMG